MRRLVIGCGVSAIASSSRTFIRMDISDRLVKYPGPVIDDDRMVRDDSFFGHDLRFQAGGGLRF